MVKKDIEPDDPMEMVGVELPGQTEEQLRDMVLCFTEEFVRNGWDENRILFVFRNPMYYGPYMAWKQKGTQYVRSAIHEAMRMWRPHHRPGKGPRGIS